MNRFKKIFAFVSLFAFLTAAFVFGGNINNKVFASAKVLKVGVNVGYVPFEFKTDNKKELQGFDIDLIKAVAEKMNCKVEFHDYVFDDLIDALNKNEVDVIISAMTITGERKAQILFSDPYFNSGLAIVANSNSKINSLSDLEGKIIFVESGTTGADIAKKVKNANVLEFDNLMDKFLIIKHWNGAALITDRPVIEYVLSSDKNINGLKISGKNLTNEEYGIGIRNSDTKLHQEINNALKNLKNSGEYNKIYNKWFK
ncbi:MAG: transporter substrate-binding domain-containing protein [Selenomonadaceae bacterium]|nr:transporter substrate-binding domain-containing protein [Selenomonadaceae bacterium]